MLHTSKYHKNEQQLQEELRQIEAARQNPARFEPLYNAYYEPIFRYVYQRVEDKESAFDITSQVFLKALTNLPKYQYKGVPFASWLYRIATNEVYESFRQNQAKRAINVDSVHLFDMIDDMEEARGQEMHDLLLKVLPELAEDDLQMIEMRYFEKRSFKEVSEILDITETNAKVRAHRIIEKLKKIFHKHLKEL
ncbi:MAG: RNA polymerase sigma factor [Bacteroidota bacterium]